MAKFSDRGEKAGVQSVLAVLVAAILVTVLFVGNVGSAAAEAEYGSPASGDASSGRVVLGTAPEWPFRGFFVAHLGRFWDTGRGLVHDTGPHLGRRYSMPCLHEYFVVGEEAVRVGYRDHGERELFGYVIPWGDLAYPVIDGRSAPVGPFGGSSLGEQGADSAVSGSSLGLGVGPGVEVTLDYDAAFAVGGRDGVDGLDLPAGWSSSVGWSLAAFRVAIESEGESGAGQWYLTDGNVRGFVETATVEAGEMDPEAVLDAVTDDSGRAFGHHYPYILDGTDGRYYALEMWSYSEANCSYVYRTFVVDGVSGEVVGCFETRNTEIGSGLVFVAAPQADRLERFELPSAAVPVGLDACRYRLDGPELDGFPFAGFAPRGGDA